VFSDDLPPESLVAMEDAYSSFVSHATALVHLDKVDHLEPLFVTYFRSVDRIEQLVTSILTTKLEATTSADEM
jgi:hypothetical protein